jgi:homoserine O-acetyltransferase/O-succinyltransferase
MLGPGWRGMKTLGYTTLLLLAAAASAPAAPYPEPVAGDCLLRDFRFTSGETLPELRVHYRTFGTPRRDASGVVRNAVLILHGTGGEGGNFINQMFAGELFGKGQPLDAGRYYLIVPDNLGHGRSTKPSDGLRARFPRYGYRDMILAQYRLLTEGLGVNHLRLVLGASMGGMQTWLWGEEHPDFMDLLVPMGCQPGQISGRNRMWRKMMIELIRTDPEWHGGDYTTQPRSLKFAKGIFYLMGGNSILRQEQGPTLKQADEFFEREITTLVARMDANDYLYAIESSHDYDPEPGLEKIRASILAINFADDYINPPELGILERAIKRVRNGRALVIPMSAETLGHGTLVKAAVWKDHLEKFLKESER